MDEVSKYIRRETIKLMYEHGASHYGGSLSCVDILVALYYDVMKDDDIFLLSKGHACWPLYVILREEGLNPKLEHHPHRDINNGINMTSGSLGHGIPFGIGVALAKRIKKESGNVFVLIGDGCVQEGTFWEGVQILGKLGLDNIIILWDRNYIQGSDWCKNTLPFVFPYMDVVIVGDVECGHDIDTLTQRIKPRGRNPRIYQINTIKGRGVSFMENDPSWHSRALTESEYTQALKELQ